MNHGRSGEQETGNREQQTGAPRFVLLAFVFLLFPVTCSLFPLLIAADAPHRPPLSIALDAGEHSTMLRAELERVWKPSQSLGLTDCQYAAADNRLKPFREMQAAIRERFIVRYVFSPPGIDCPAVRIGGGAWETIHPWAFTCETRPLTTVDWLCRRHHWWFEEARDSIPAGFGDCSDTRTEGWSGGDETTAPPAPWAVNPRVQGSRFEGPRSKTSQLASWFSQP